jgi:hypothetical protein
MIDSGDFEDQPPAKKKLLIKFLTYKKEIRKPYKAISGLRTQWNNFKKYPEAELSRLLNLTMANEYHGIVWEKARTEAVTSSPVAAIPKKKYFNASDYDREIKRRTKHIPMP